MGGLKPLKRPKPLKRRGHDFKGLKGRALRVLLVGVALLGVPAALAMPRFRLQAIQAFHYDQGNPLWAYDRRVMACTYCHVNEGGGAPWNAFGQSLQAAFKASALGTSAQAGRGGSQGGTFPQVLYALLQAEQDADADGYADVLEVYARTLPGDAASRPDKPAATVRAEFEAAGGAAQFAPAARK